ncbi:MULTISPECIES: manganese-binding transcriptional regulator MntR [Inquilinus]|jgi:DtxR family manganese transport transcriptional regulator|uniref:Transcriptional regulator MntR n=1 Tax=Inquilinus ginsengisoli TaxID=363840 RepID=A0ABU1K078_9PROT|nr:manganese-binding transcriptional regulator MntR [Inquilinus ginsengisoli]MDR6294271.1 DtxR family manganese transport transcriptional regulator [Inquilinus ginsengisoli]
MDDQDRLADTELQAAGFSRVRQARQTETAEDYVEMIAELIDSQGEARIVELAERFGVAHATVNKTVARLQREGLVSARPYRSIFLTDAGRAMADACRKRHRIVVEFLKSIGVSDDVAEIDAEGIEHHVSEETLAAFERLVVPKA